MNLVNDGGEAMLLDQNEAISNDLKEFLELSPYAAIFINQQAEVVYYNNKGLEFLKASCFEWVFYGKRFNFFNYIAKNLQPQAELMIENIKMILAGKQEEYKFEYCSDQNEYFEVKISKFKAGVLILYKNISERKITEQKLFREKIWSDALFENSNSSIALLDENHLVLDVNQKFEETFSYQLKEIKGRDLDNVLQTENGANINRELTARVLNGEYIEAEGLRSDKHGKAISFIIKGVPIIVDSEIKGIYAVYEDISERKTAEKKIKSLKERYRTIFEHGPMGILLLDSEGIVLQANQTLLEYSGYDRSELVGSSIFETVVLKGNRKTAQKFIKRILKGEEVEYIGESIRKNGEVFPILFKERAIEIPGQGNCVLSMQLDYTEYKKQQQKIRYIGYHDQLTDCYNRSYIEKELKKYDQAKYLPLSVVMIDINGLTLVNESYGYKTGDQLLIKVSSKLKTLLAAKDMLGRWSGDEFIILLPESDEEEISELRKAVDFFCDSSAEDEIPVSLGFGSAVKDELNDNIYHVINQADRNMNQDKLTKSRSSKNKFVKNLINTLGAKSNETKEHALRMTSMAFNLGDSLNLSHQELNKLNLLATLHDIGKVTISEKILNKAGKLSDEQWKIIKTHPVKGAAIADSTEEFSSIAELIRHHHERWDGSGYPDGLAGEEIPLLSRIISLVDSYDVMTNERPYKKAMSKKEAIKEIRRCAGSQFDPGLAVEFIKLLEGEGSDEE
jgi:diguanylate cyclase (GGDEF)-like protein/PAS domain S-box-containing protein